MTYKDISVYLGPECNAASAARYAIVLADVFAAHLTGYALAIEPPIAQFAFPEPMSAGATGFDVEIWMEEDARVKTATRAVAGSFEAGTASGTPASACQEIAVGNTEAGDLLKLLARYSDLMIAPLPGADDANYRRRLETTLIGSGRPLLLIPPMCDQSPPPKVIAIGWDGSREAARSVADAIPLLKRAEAVYVIVIDPKGERDIHQDLPGADLATHLARHGIEVIVDTRSSGSDTKAATLLAVAAERNAECLVIGGYGHSRLHEFILGGITRKALVDAVIPVFIAH